MKKQEQIDALRREIERIKEHIGLPYIYIHKGNLNHSEKPNSCIPDFVPEYPFKPNGIISIPYGLTDSEEKSYIEMQKQIMQDAFEIKRDKFMEKFKQTESTQYELPDFVPDWKDAPEDANCLAMDKDGQWWWYGNKAVISSMSFIGDWIESYPGQCTNATRLHPDYWKQSLQERPEPDYTHLLPEGYEFCTEQDAEKWVKVEMDNLHKSVQFSIGEVSDDVFGYIGTWKPIRPIQYLVSVHESVTAEPDPYQVDWSNAPEWADVHCFDRDRRGYWYGHRYNVIISDWESMTIGSNFNLPEGKGIERKFSKTIRPKLK
jgi:hypothetical protein